MKSKNLYISIIFSMLFINAASSFDFVDLRMEEHQLTFKTYRETDSYPFYIEQWINEQWITIDEVYGKGGIDTNIYEIPISTLLYGINKFRVKKETGWDYCTFSSPIKIFHNENKVFHFAEKSKILFSDSAYYKVTTKNGAIVNEGRSNAIDLSELQKGSYQLWYNNRLQYFRKRRNKIVFRNKP